MNTATAPELEAPQAKPQGTQKIETELVKAFRIWVEHPTSSFKLQRLVVHMVGHELAARLTGSTRAD